MTVKQLIAELSKYPDDAEVVICGGASIGDIEDVFPTDWAVEWYGAGVKIVSNICSG